MHNRENGDFTKENAIWINRWVEISGLAPSLAKCYMLSHTVLESRTVWRVNSVHLSCIASVTLRHVPSFPAFWGVFIINRCWVLSKAFSASIEIIIWLLFFNLLMWYIILIDLQIFKNPCIPGIKPTWSWCMIFLICCWILFARILLIFHPCSSVILAYRFLFLVIFV